MKGGDATHSRGPRYTKRNNYGKENYPSRGPTPSDQAKRNQQQGNLQGYINPPTMQQWNRQGAGNAVDREMAYAQNLCYRCGSNAHMARDCDAWNQRNRVTQQRGNGGTVAAITQGMEQLQTQPNNAPMPHQSPPGILRPQPMPISQPMEGQGYVPAPEVRDYVRHNHIGRMGQPTDQ